MIDDNVQLVDMVKEYFSNSNRIDVVITANDGEDGVKKIIDNEGKYDLILLDLIMPNKDGLYVLDELKKRDIDKKVIVATTLSYQ